DYQSLALKSDGTVVAWGVVWNGSAYVTETVPTGLSSVVAIAAGGDHSLALKSDGTVVAWGYNNYGQCTVPTGLSGVVAIAAGEYHSLALKSDGTVVAWGYNGYGQCTVPVGLSGVVAIAAGDYRSQAIVTASTPNVLHGRVTDSNGSAVAGGTVSALLGQTPAAQVTTDGNGDYQFPTLSAGAYVLTVTASGYANAARAFTFNGNTSVQNFQLTALPVTPATQQTTRQIPPAFLQPPPGPQKSTLKVFDGTQFVDITAQNTPSANVMTIVLTHGWTRDPNCTANPGISGWPTTMAAAMWAEGIKKSVANIVAWDWYDGAKFDGALVCSLPPAENTPSQGVALGQWLQEVLGVNYAMPVHFIGHSLGTLVNAAAINYLHGVQTATSRQEKAVTPWTGSMHVTLFDEAERAYSFDWVWQHQPVMPDSSTWADNYVSLVGYAQSGAVNVNLPDGIILDGPINAHGYPMEWYDQSVLEPTDINNPLGFRQSYEYRTLVGYPNPPLLPPSNVPVNSGYQQSAWNNDELALVASATVNITLGIVPDTVVRLAAVGTVEIVGNVTAQVEASAMGTEQAIQQGFNYVGNVAAQDKQALVKLFSSPLLQLNLNTGPASVGQQVQGNALQTLDVGGNSTNGPAMAWVPVPIPSNAVSMAFDFIIAGDPVDDVLVFGIETNNLFSLEAKYIPTNTVSGSRLIDVSVWAGTTNELFFGLMGATSTNATLQIDNIRFYGLESNLVDSVGDGIFDSWRAQYFPNVDPTGATTNNLSCATCDADGTGQNNMFKYVAGLNPTNPASVFTLQIQNVANQPTHKNLLYGPIANGCTYVVESTTNLVGGAWTPQAVSAPLTNVNQVIVMDANATTPQKLYRVSIYNVITNIVVLDSIGDGIPDTWRGQYFPSVPSNTTNGQSCATCDADGTGQNNFFKYVAGLDPTNSASVFAVNVTGATNQSKAMNLNFNPLALGRTYTPEFNTNLVKGVWLPLTTYTGLLTNGNQVTITDTNPIPPQEFYRIDISLP
ncbi:MAG: carboxypeptidase regulatory-like domain-containing protein, partial [Verrucomicrobiia bacterium]